MLIVILAIVLVVVAWLGPSLLMGVASWLMDSLWGRDER